MKPNKKCSKFSFKNFHISGRRLKINRMSKPKTRDTSVILFPLANMESSESAEPPGIMENNGNLMGEGALPYRLSRELADKDEDEREDRRYERTTYQQLVLERIVFKYF
jgi:hypothetical protein